MAAGTPLSSAYGYCVVTTTSDSAIVAVLDNSTVQLNSMNIEDDVTTSANSIGTRKMAYMVDPAATITLPEDDPSSVEASGLIAKNTSYNLWLRRGISSTASHQWDKLASTVCTGWTKDNQSSSGVKRTMVCEFKGGDYTGYTAMAATITSALTGLTPARG